MKIWPVRFLYLQNMYQDQTDGDLDDIIVSMSDADKMSIFLPSIKELDEEDQGLDREAFRTLVESLV